MMSGELQFDLKNKGDAHSCTHYHGIKRMSYSVKTWESVIESISSRDVTIMEQRYGVMHACKCVTDAIFAFNVLAAR